MAPAQGPPGPCHVCGASSTSRCGACGSVLYCSREHQTQDWKAHKAECRALTRAKTLATALDGDPNAATIEAQLNDNATALLSIEKGPLVIPEPLRTALERHGSFFHQGEWLQSTDKRFLATCGVLTCVAVFARTTKVSLTQQGG